MRPARSSLLLENQWCSELLCDQPLKESSQIISYFPLRYPILRYPMLPTPTRSSRQGTHSLWVQNFSAFRLSPILTGCLLPSKLLQFAKFKKSLLFILLAFARSDSAWFFLFSPPLYTSWPLRTFCYLFAVFFFLPFLVGSWSVPNSFSVAVIHSVRSGYSSYNLFSLVGMQSYNGFSILDLKKFQTSSTSSCSAELINQLP